MGVPKCWSAPVARVFIYTGCPLWAPEPTLPATMKGHILRMRNLRSALVAAALAAGTTVTAAAADASAAIAVHPASGQPAPGAPHSGHVVPGLTGAALRRVLPADVSRRFSELHAPRHASAPPVAPTHAAGRAAGLTPWTGAFRGLLGA